MDSLTIAFGMVRPASGLGGSCYNSPSDPCGGSFDSQVSAVIALVAVGLALIAAFTVLASIQGMYIRLRARRHNQRAHARWDGRVHSETPPAECRATLFQYRGVRNTTVSLEAITCEACRRHTTTEAT